MNKTMIINGMSCGHCKARVEQALKAVAGVANAEVDLDSKSAVLTLTQEVSDEQLTKAVTDAGYEVAEIK